VETFIMKTMPQSEIADCFEKMLAAARSVETNALKLDAVMKPLHEAQLEGIIEHYTASTGISDDAGDVRGRKYPTVVKLLGVVRQFHEMAGLPDPTRAVNIQRRFVSILRGVNISLSTNHTIL
jgi:hypothetical protein